MIGAMTKTMTMGKIKVLKAFHHTFLFLGDVEAEATIANSKQLLSGVIHLLILPGLPSYKQGVSYFQYQKTSGFCREIHHSLVGPLA